MFSQASSFLRFKPRIFFLLVLNLGFGGQSFGAGKRCLDYILIGEISPILAQLLSNSPDNELLTAEEEKDLFLRQAQGFQAQRELEELSEMDPRRKECLITIAKGQDARSELILANLRLVASVAKTFRNRGLSFEDLISEGNIGLIRAVDGFDLEYGTRLSTYAVYWIRQAIFSALIKSGSTIRVSSNMVPLVTKFRRTEKELTLSLSRRPSFEEVVSSLEINKDQAELLRSALRTQNVKGFPDLAIEDQPEAEVSALATTDPLDSEPGRNLSKLEEGKKLQEAIDQLRRIDLRMPALVRLRFLEGKSRLDAARELKISAERARQLETRSLKELKKALAVASE